MSRRWGKRLRLCCKNSIRNTPDKRIKNPNNLLLLVQSGGAMISGNSGSFGLVAPELLLPVFSLYKSIYKYLYIIYIRVIRVVCGYVMEIHRYFDAFGQNIATQPELPEFPATGLFFFDFCLCKWKEQTSGNSTRIKKIFARIRATLGAK
jgi:hypothetical protein